MPTLNPLLDPAPASLVQSERFEAVAPVTFAEASPPPNLLLGVLRRWPWLMLGLITGLVLGVLYHMQRTPVYQASAQLLVIKNRPEVTTTGSSADSRVQFVEDYVATQVLYLRSERILAKAANRLNDSKYRPFQVPPPAEERDRVAYLMKQFMVTREKEPGSNTLSNILLLTFKSDHPADAPKYLAAIIDAYRDDLGGVYSDASMDQLKGLDKEIEVLGNSLNTLELARRKVERQLRGDEGTGVEGLSQEELISVRQRISANRNVEQTLRLRKIALEQELEQINAAGMSRATRLAVMGRLGIQSDRPNILGVGDAKDPDTMLAFLKYQRAEFTTKYGPGHPDMISLNNRIKLLEDEIEKRGGPPDDELDRYRRRQENEIESIKKQLEVLKQDIAADEKKATNMSDLEDKIRTLKASQDRDETILRDKVRDRDHVTATKSVGGYKVEDVTKPGEGIQVAPVLVQSLLLGAVFGLLLGGGLGLWAEMADRSFRSPADIRRLLGLPVLGHVPPIKITEEPENKPEAALDPVLAVWLRPHSAEAEAVRGIRTQLLFSTSGREHQVLQVTSPNPGDGKSTLAANLAISLAQSNKRVVLVDCDFRKPRVHRMFALEHPEIGLASVVADQADLGGAVQACEIENLSLLPCGPRPANPAELLTTPKFQEVLDDLRAIYDFVVLDTPPVLAVSDPAAVAPRADGIILVFRMTKDSRPAAERAKQDLTAVGGHIFGVVVNASTDREMGYGYGYGYKYDYQYSDSYADAKS